MNIISGVREMREVTANDNCTFPSCCGSARARERACFHSAKYSLPLFMSFAAELIDPTN